MTDATLIKLKPSDWFPGLTPASRLSISAEWGVIIDGELVARIAKRSSGWTVEDPKTYVRIQGSGLPTRTREEAFHNFVTFNKK
mgnify:CR=1 FL=1